jgi:hypothetical protein
MFKAISALILLLALGLNARANQMDMTPDPEGVRATYDKDYVYVKVPLAITMDQEQKDAFRRDAQLIINGLQASPRDTSFDGTRNTRAVLATINTYDDTVDNLCTIVNSIHSHMLEYNSLKWAALPSALLVYFGVSFQKNYLKIFSRGGSVTVGFVFVPVRVKRISRTDPTDSVEWVTWLENSAMVVLPTYKIGPETIAPKRSVLYGGGLIYGPLEQVSDLSGITVGVSSNINIGGGYNVKVVGVESFHKPGLFSNYIVSAGRQLNTAKIADSRWPKWLSPGFYVGGIIDLLPYLSAADKAAGGLETMINKLSEADPEAKP